MKASMTRLVCVLQILLMTGLMTSFPPDLKNDGIMSAMAIAHKKQVSKKQAPGKKKTVAGKSAKAKPKACKLASGKAKSAKAKAPKTAAKKTKPKKPAAAKASKAKAKTQAAARTKASKAKTKKVAAVKSKAVKTKTKKLAATKTKVPKTKASKPAAAHSIAAKPVVATAIAAKPAATKPAQVKTATESIIAAADLEDVMTKLDELEDAKKFTEAIRRAGLDGVLSRKGSFTVFVPTDKAIANMPAMMRKIMTNTHPDDGGKERLINILHYHVILQQLNTKDMRNHTKRATAKGDMIRFSNEPSVTKILGMRDRNDAIIIRKDINCSNGVIHIVDQVLLPGDTDYRDRKKDLLRKH